MNVVATKDNAQLQRYSSYVKRETYLVSIFERFMPHASPGAWSRGSIFSIGLGTLSWLMGHEPS